MVNVNFCIFAAKLLFLSQTSKDSRLFVAKVPEMQNYFSNLVMTLTCDCVTQFH